MYERFEELLNENGMKVADVAKGTGIRSGVFTDWKKGRYVPKADKLRKIAEFFGVRLEWLMGETDEKNPYSFRYSIPYASEQNNFDDNYTRNIPVTIPVYERVAAGMPIEASGNIIDEVCVSSTFMGANDIFALLVNGRSMEPRIMNGDIVIVRKQDDAETGEIVVVMVNGNDATCKRLKKLDNGIMLISINPECDPIVYTAEKVVSLPVRIVGKVIEIRSRV